MGKLENLDGVPFLVAPSDLGVGAKGLSGCRTTGGLGRVGKTGDSLLRAGNAEKPLSVGEEARGSSGSSRSLVTAGNAFGFTSGDETAANEGNADRPRGCSRSRCCGGCRGEGLLSTAGKALKDGLLVLGSTGGRIGVGAKAGLSVICFGMKEGNVGSDAVLPTGLAGKDAKASAGKEVAGRGVFTGSRTGTGTGL